MFWRGQPFIICFPLFIPSVWESKKKQFLGFLSFVQDSSPICASLFASIISRNPQNGQLVPLSIENPLLLAYTEISRTFERVLVGIELPTSYHCKFSANSVERALMAVAPNLLNDDLKPKACIILSFLLTAKHWVCQSIQQRCPSSSSVLSWCWDVLVSGERRLLPSFCRQRMWRKLQRTEWAHPVSHRGLWRMDENHHCYSKVSCIQVKWPFLLCAIVAISEEHIFISVSSSHLSQ